MIVRFYRRLHADDFWEFLEFPEKPTVARQYRNDHYHFVGEFKDRQLRAELLRELKDALDERGADGRHDISIELAGATSSQYGRPRHVGIGSIVLEHSKWSAPSGTVLHQVCAQYNQPQVFGEIALKGEPSQGSMDSICGALNSLGYRLRK